MFNFVYYHKNKDGKEFNKIISDTQNLYVGNGNTTYLASNSLPSASYNGVTTSFVNTIDLNIQSLRNKMMQRHCQSRSPCRITVDGAVSNLYTR